MSAPKKSSKSGAADSSASKPKSSKSGGANQVPKPPNRRQRRAAKHQPAKLDDSDVKTSTDACVPTIETPPPDRSIDDLKLEVKEPLDEKQPIQVEIPELESKEVGGIVEGNEVKIGRPKGVEGKNKPESKENADKHAFRFPAVRRHRHEDFPQVSYYFPKGLSYTPEKLKAIGRYHPEPNLSDLKVWHTDNEHPYCAAMRSMLEAIAISAAINECCHIRGSDLKIMDVGGSANRHFSNKRHYMHSCIPQYDARDIIRQFARPSKTSCTHRWQDCDCLFDANDPSVKPLLSISVHSLYYIPPGDILVQLLKQHLPVHYAVVHLYKGEEGVSMMGEMQHVRKDGQIWVKALGNLTWYYHPDNKWMEEGHYSDSNGTLEWDFHRRFDDIVILRFVAISTPSLAPPLPPASLLGDKKENKNKKQTQPPESSEGAEAELVAKEIKLCTEQVRYGRPITPKEYQSYLDRVQRRGERMGMNTERLMAYASYKWTTQQELLAATPVALHNTASKRSLALNLTAFELDWKKISVATLFLLVVVLLIITGPDRWLPGVRWLWINRNNNVLWGTITCILAVFAAPYWWPKFKTTVNCYNKRELPTSILEFFRQRALAYDYCCELPNKKTDPTKLIRLTAPDDHEFECERKPAAYAMVYHPDYVPYFPRKCSHNVVCSITNKLLQEIPGAGKYSFGLHPILRQVAREIRPFLSPLSWDEWFTRFPGSKETRLRDEKERRAGDYYTDEEWNASGFFIKFEGYPEPKFPRPIVSAGVEFNFGIGRWLIPIAEQLSEFLPSNVSFPLHGDSAEMGRFHDRYRHFDMHDVDFSAFDSSQRDEALLVIIDFLRECGVPEMVLQREALDMKSIMVTTRNGLKVVMRGMRCSGRSATLVGNSIVTLNVVMHLFPDYVAITVKGDDTVLYMNRILDPDECKARYLENGLLAKFRVVDEEEVSFCSSLYLPVLEQSVMVGLPGKLLAKTFWCKNLHYSEKEVQQQFASILKGMYHTISITPGIRGLLRNPVYKKWFPIVDAFRHEYNEYTDEAFTITDETYFFMCRRYDLSIDQILELEEELASSFPVRLSCVASRIMIEKDWGPDNDADHLTENEVNRLPKIIGEALFEEILRYIAPFWISLIIGSIESFGYGTWFNLFAHLIYAVVMVVFGPFYSLVLHVLVNLAGPKTNIVYLAMKNKKKTVTTVTTTNRVKPKKEKKKKTKSSKPPQMSNLGRITQIARMLNDPCNSHLVDGTYGSSAGVLTRFRTSVVPGEANTSGFIVWVPGGRGNLRASNTGMNCIIFNNNDANFQIVNTALDPLGAGVSTSGYSLRAGAGTFVDTSACEDFRTVAACMRMTYVGNTSDCAGRFAILDNIPANILINDRPSVARMFDYARSTSRISLESQEIKFRPDTYTELYKDEKSTVFTTDAPSVMSKEALAAGPTMVGFAWTGIPTNQLFFEFIQCIEWRPQVGQGYVEPPPTQIAGDDLYKRALLWLDSTIPGWSTKAMNMASRVASMAVNRILGGPPQISSIRPNFRTIEY